MKHSIFSREFWHQYWIAIRRSKKDSRDRKNVLRFTFALIAFIGYYGYLLFYVREAFDHGMILPACIGLAFGLMITIGIAVNNHLDARKARIESDLAVDKILRQKLASDGFALSVLMLRAESEATLRSKELPPEIQVITRQAHLAQLRKLDIWDQLPSKIKDLLLLPDGHWPPGVLNLPASFENLRCIRWALRLDDRLEPLTWLPKMDYKPAAELLIKPERLLTSIGMVDIWDIRVERNNADGFFSRCYAEAVGRGLLKPNKNELHSWAINVFENAKESDQRDMLVRHETINELDESTFAYVWNLGYHRYSCLAVIMDLVDGVDRWEDWNNLFFPIAEASEEIHSP